MTAGARRAHRRSLSNLETIVGFAAILRARGVSGGSEGERVRASLAVATDMLRYEQLGAVAPGGLARAVVRALDRSDVARFVDVHRGES